MICPACLSEQSPHDCFMGALGSRKHYRCRFCGWWWARG